MDDPNDPTDIDRALAEAGRAVEAPEALRHRIRAEIDRSVRRRRAVASGAVMTMAVAFGTGLWLAGGPQAPQAPQGQSDRIAQAPGAESPPTESPPSAAPPAGPEFAEPPAVTVRMTDPAMFAAPVRSARPNVSIVRVYRDPTIEREAPEDPADESPPAKPSSELETRIWQVEHGE